MLTSDDIDLLLEAIDAWEREPNGTALISSLMGFSIAKDESDAKKHMIDKMETAKIAIGKRYRRAILLKAKLIQMQDESATDQLFSRVVCKDEAQPKTFGVERKGNDNV